MADIKEMIQMKKRHFDVETDGFYGAYIIRRKRHFLMH